MNPIHGTGRIKIVVKDNTGNSVHQAHVIIISDSTPSVQLLGVTDTNGVVEFHLPANSQASFAAFHVHVFKASLSAYAGVGHDAAGAASVEITLKLF